MGTPWASNMHAGGKKEECWREMSARVRKDKVCASHKLCFARQVFNLLLLCLDFWVFEFFFFCNCNVFCKQKPRCKKKKKRKCIASKSGKRQLQFAQRRNLPVGAHGIYRTEPVIRKHIIRGPKTTQKNKNSPLDGTYNDLSLGRTGNIHSLWSDLSCGLY